MDELGLFNRWPYQLLNPMFWVELAGEMIRSFIGTSRLNEVVKQVDIADKDISLHPAIADTKVADNEVSGEIHLGYDGAKLYLKRSASAGIPRVCIELLEAKLEKFQHEIPNGMFESSLIVPVIPAAYLATVTGKTTEEAYDQFEKIVTQQSSVKARFLSSEFAEAKSIWSEASEPYWMIGAREYPVHFEELENVTVRLWKKHGRVTANLEEMMSYLILVRPSLRAYEMMAAFGAVKVYNNTTYYWPVVMHQEVNGGERLYSGLVTSNPGSLSKSDKITVLTRVARY